MSEDTEFLTTTFHELDPNGKSPHEAGAKLDQGKVMAGLLQDFSLALMSIAEVGTFGANKYTRGGWQSVENGIERYNDAKWRHALKEHTEPVDADSGLLHTAHEAWNALAKLELILRGREIKPEDATAMLTKGSQATSKPRNTDTTKATKARVDKMAEHRGVIRSVIKKIIDVEPYKLSNRGIARKLTERGYKTALGKSFNHVQVARILSEDCSGQQRVEL